MAAYGLTIPELMKLIPSENVNISAGGLETPGTKFNVRVPAEFAQPEEVDHLLLTVRDGKPIYLTDVATVRDTFKDRLSFSRLDGQSSITLSVQKRVGANIMDIARGVKAILDEARTMMPQGVKFDLTLDQPRTSPAWWPTWRTTSSPALILVLVVLMVFMGLRVSADRRPGHAPEHADGFAILQAMGYTLNMIVLFSLILAVGMLVDNAIVIVENIYRHMQLGYGRIEAAMKGTAEVAWPVITSTLTTVAAFVPMLFWPGIIGDFMKYLPITVIVTLICSLFVAHGDQPDDLRDGLPGQGRQGRQEALVPGRLPAVPEARAEPPPDRPCPGLAAAGGRGLGLQAGGPRGGVLPQSDPERAVINIRCPQGTNIRQTDRLTQHDRAARRIVSLRAQRRRGD